MIRARGVAESRPDAPVLFFDQFLVREPLVGCVGPLLAHPLVQALGEGLGHPVGQGSHEDRVVVVVGLLEVSGEFSDPDAGRYREGTDVIGESRVVRSDEVGQAAVRTFVGLRLLLAQHVEAQPLARPLFVFEEHDILAVRVRRPEAVDSAVFDEFFVDEAPEQLLPVGE